MKAQLKKNRVKPVIVNGETICHVRALSINQHKALRERVRSLPQDLEEADQNLTAAKYSIAETACDESGKLIFSGPEDPDLDDIDVATLGIVFEASQESAGYTGKA